MLNLHVLNILLAFHAKADVSHTRTIYHFNNNSTCDKKNTPKGFFSRIAQIFKVEFAIKIREKIKRICFGGTKKLLV